MCGILLPFKKESSELFVVVFVQSHILCVQVCVYASFVVIVLVSQICVFVCVEALRKVKVKSSIAS